MQDDIDEKDVLTQLATARRQITTLTAERDSAVAQLAVEKKRVDALKPVAGLGVEEIASTLAAVTAERDAAVSERDTLRRENSRLTKSQENFDDRLSEKVRTDLLKFGVSPTAVTLPRGDANPNATDLKTRMADPNFNLTEWVLTAKKTETDTTAAHESAQREYERQQKGQQ